MRRLCVLGLESLPHQAEERDKQRNGCPERDREKCQRHGGRKRKLWQIAGAASEARGGGGMAAMRAQNEQLRIANMRREYPYRRNSSKTEITTPIA